MFLQLLAAISATLLVPGLAAPVSEGSLSSRDVQSPGLQPRAKTSFSVPATSQSKWNDGWMIPLQVGNQNMQVRMDTGSATFWLLSNRLNTSDYGKNHTIYTPSASASLVQGETYNATYDDNSGTRGVVYADTLVIGSATVTSQAVGAASSVSSVKDGPNSGLLGLNYYASQDTMGPTRFSSVSSNLMSQLTDPVIAMDLRNGADGSVSFGAVDRTKYTGQLTYAPRRTDGNYSWNVDVLAAYVNGVLIQGQPSAIAMVDTGTSLFRLPEGIVKGYYDSVPGKVLENGSYIIPCDNIRNHTMPSFAIKLGNGIATVPGDYMGYYPINSTWCRGALQYTSTRNYLGDMFLRTQYVVFNYTAPGYVGFAPKASLQPAPSL